MSTPSSSFSSSISERAQTNSSSMNSNTNSSHFAKPTATPNSSPSDHSSYYSSFPSFLHHTLLSATRQEHEINVSTSSRGPATSAAFAPADRLPPSEAFFAVPITTSLRERPSSRTGPSMAKWPQSSIRPLAQGTGLNASSCSFSSQRFPTPSGKKRFDWL